MNTTSSIIERHDRFIAINYPRYPIAIVRGTGAELFDGDGKRYIDLFAGFGASVLGHCHPDLVAAVTEQASQVWHAGNLLHTEPQTRAAEAIANHGFGGRSFFCHSGADANEAALKLARLYGQGKRYGVISTTNSFHGRSFGTMGATGATAVREGFEPLAPGYVNVPYNDLAAIEAAIDNTTVAVIVEPIQGEGGVNVPDDDYLPSLRSLCDDRDLLLIVDEVWTGCGRTGRYFAHQHWNITPDIMTLGKGVGGGLAVGVMCARPEIAELNDAVKLGKVKHATTLGGNCLSMAVTAAVFHVLQRDRLVERAAALCEQITDRLNGISRVQQIRGKGLFLGIELDGPAGDIVKQCLDRGVMINATQQTIVRLAPPLNIDDAVLDEGLTIFERVLSGA